MSFPDGGWSSHLEALGWAVAKTDGPVVEYGGGWYSTPLLHGLCEAQGRELYTVEYDQDLYHQLAQGWESDWHIVAGPGFEGLPDEPGLVFIDSPSAQRTELLARARHVPLVVVHDTEPESYDSYPGMKAQLQEFTYRRDWRLFPWATTAVSNSMVLS